MRFFGLILIVALFAGCGYRPAAQVTQSVLGENVFIDVTINVQDPKNSVLIKDALKEAMIGRLGRNVVSKEEAQTQLYGTLGSVGFSATVYDQDGYVTAYKARVSLTIVTVFETGERETVRASGEYDFTIEANSVISDARRFEAIKNASVDALDEYIAAISIRGMRHGKHDQ